MRMLLGLTSGVTRKNKALNEYKTMSCRSEINSRQNQWKKWKNGVSGLGHVLNRKETEAVRLLKGMKKRGCLKKKWSYMYMYMYMGDMNRVYVGEMDAGNRVK